MITDQKLLLASFRKDVASLLQWLQRILLQNNQYSVLMLYRPGPQLFITYWLSRHNHETNRDEKGMSITINAVDMHGHEGLHGRRRNRNSNARC